MLAHEQHAVGVQCRSGQWSADPHRELLHGQTTACVRYRSWRAVPCVFGAAGECRDRPCDPSGAGHAYAARRISGGREPDLGERRRARLSHVMTAKGRFWVFSTSFDAITCSVCRSRESLSTSRVRLTWHLSTHIGHDRPQSLPSAIRRFCSPSSGHSRRVISLRRWPKPTHGRDDESNIPASRPEATHRRARNHRTNLCWLRTGD